MLKSPALLNFIGHKGEKREQRASATTVASLACTPKNSLSQLRCSAYILSPLLLFFNCFQLSTRLAIWSSRWDALNYLSQWCKDGNPLI